MDQATIPSGMFPAEPRSTRRGRPRVFFAPRRFHAALIPADIFLAELFGLTRFCRPACCSRRFDGIDDDGHGLRLRRVTNVAKGREALNWRLSGTQGVRCWVGGEADISIRFRGLEIGG